MALFNVPKETQGSSLPAILMGGFVAFGGILFGYDTGTIGGILAMGETLLKQYFVFCVYAMTDLPGFLDYWVNLFATETNADGQKYITTGQQGLIVSILSVGTFFGALSAASMGDRIGRRWGLLSMSPLSERQKSPLTYSQLLVPSSLPALCYKPSQLLFLYSLRVVVLRGQVLA
jgi:SP family sugar:H+ symporter-like MFS transporter